MVKSPLYESVCLRRGKNVTCEILLEISKIPKNRHYTPKKLGQNPGKCAELELNRSSRSKVMEFFVLKFKDFWVIFLLENPDFWVIFQPKNPQILKRKIP